ncbi:hypothetical protein C0989_003471, partial [Termitomyces sp. Mn162]
LINILTTVALTSKPAKLRTAAIAIASLLNANVTDHISDALANAIATKTLNCISSLVNKLKSTMDFLTANNAKQAKSMLTLRAMSKTLEEVSTSLDALASKLTNAPSPMPAGPPSWASILKSAPSQPAPPSSTPGLNSLIPNKITQVQQHMCHNTCSILI